MFTNIYVSVDTVMGFVHSLPKAIKLVSHIFHKSAVLAQPFLHTAQSSASPETAGRTEVFIRFSKLHKSYMTKNCWYRTGIMYHFCIIIYGLTLVN